MILKLHGKFGIIYFIRSAIVLRDRKGWAKSVNLNLLNLFETF